MTGSRRSRRRVQAYGVIRLALGSSAYGGHAAPRGPHGPLVVARAAARRLHLRRSGLG